MSGTERPEMPDWQILAVRCGCLFLVLLIVAGCTQLITMAGR